MDKIVKVLKKIDAAVDIVIVIITFTVLAYGCYAAYDAQRVIDQGSSALTVYKPKAEEKDSFSGLLSECEDTVGWITIEGVIDLPVVQGEDNSEYLSKWIDGSYSLSGTPFLDYRCASDFSGGYSIIYGHHMDGGALFGPLTNYHTQEYLEEHPDGTLMTPNGTKTIKWFACVNTDTSSVFYENPVLMSPDNICKTALEQADTSLNCRQTEKIIALSTCSEIGSDARTILFGYLSDENENMTEEET